MTQQTVEAVYAGGVLRPLKPLDGIEENVHVTVTVTTPHEGRSGPLDSCVGILPDSDAREMRDIIESSSGWTPMGGSSSPAPAAAPHEARHVALDTNRAITVLNGDPGAAAQVAGAARVYLPVPVLAELLYGALNSRNAAANVARVEQLRGGWTVSDVQATAAAE